jgi:hypothetical protein
MVIANQHHQVQGHLAASQKWVRRHSQCQDWNPCMLCKPWMPTMCAKQLNMGCPKIEFFLCWRGMCVTVGAPCRPVIYTESAKLFGNFQSMPKMQCYGPYNQNALSVGASGHLKDHIVPVWFHIASAIHDK